MLAYVLITLKEGSEASLQDKLSGFREVLESKILFGEWDILVKISAENPDALATFVMDKIRSEPGVKLTSTLIVAK
jgi:DNA-binding Lrp family transcriptional regulator